MFEKKFALNLEARLSGSPFSFDELIQETKALFELEGVPGFPRVLLAFCSFQDMDRYFDRNNSRVEPVDDPFNKKV